MLKMFIAKSGKRGLRFDPRELLKRVDKAKAKVLKGQAAFVRTAAKSSIRKRKRYSAPGKPPSSHAGHLRRLIYFDFDRKSDDMIIGPLIFGGAKRTGAVANVIKVEAHDTVPNTLEFGGTVTVTRRTGWLRTQKRVRHVKTRPFMRPALIKGLDDFVRKWKDSVK